MSRDIALNIAINAGQALSQAEQLRAELEATEQAAAQPVVLTADDQASPAIQEVVDLIELVGREPARVVLTADVAEAQAAFDTALARMDDIAGLSDAMVLDFQVDFEDARTELETVEEKLRTLDAMDTTVKARAEVDAAVTDIDSVAEKLASLEGADTEVIVAARNQAQAELTRIDAALVALDGQTATAVVTAKDSARADLEYVRGELAEIDGMLVSAGVTVDTSAAEGGLRRVSDEAGRSRQELGTVGGEAVQGLSSLLGPLQGVSYELGNVADQALSGESSLKDMTSGLVGLGVGGTVLFGISQHMKRMAESKAFDTARIQDFSEAVRAGDQDLQSFFSNLDGSKGNRLEYFDDTIIGGGIKDMTADLAAVGLTAADVQEAIALSDEEFQNWHRNLVEGLDSIPFSVLEELPKLQRQYKQSLEDTGEQMTVYADTQAQITAAYEQFARNQDPLKAAPELWDRVARSMANGVAPAAKDINALAEQFSLTNEQVFKQGASYANDYTAAVQGAVDVTGDLIDSGVAAAEEAVAFARDMAADAADRAAEATQREVDALHENVTALDERVNAQRGAVDAGYALADSQDAFAQATLTATQAMNAGTPGEQAAAYRDLAQSAQLVADNTVRVAEETAAANGTSLSRKAAIDIENGALLAQAGTLTGPMRAALVEHIGRINGIPPKKISEIQALIDQGKIGEAEGLLTRTSRTRKSAIEATANEGAAEEKLNQTARVNGQVAVPGGGHEKSPPLMVI